MRAVKLLELSENVSILELNILCVQQIDAVIFRLFLRGKMNAILCVC